MPSALLLPPLLTVTTIYWLFWLTLHTKLMIQRTDDDDSELLPEL